METKDELGDKKWNNQDKKSDLNEGFSGENIPENYNPAKENVKTHLQIESETDADGNRQTVKRARFPGADSPEGISNESADNREMANKDSIQNRDRNYDKPDRYPPSHPDNQKNRGNIELDE